MQDRLGSDDYLKMKAERKKSIEIISCSSRERKLFYNLHWLEEGKQIVGKQASWNAVSEEKYTFLGSWFNAFLYYSKWMRN